MTPKMIFKLTLLFLTCGLFTLAQNHTEYKSVVSYSKFSLSISTYNHAEQILNGTLIYNLKDSVFTISRRTIFSEKDTSLFSKTIDIGSIDRIKSIRIDTLKDFYFNNCIMMTSGNEYFVSTTLGEDIKKVHLHHYYVRQIEMLINEVNKQIPDSLKINYLTKDTTQDCE